MGSDQGFLKGVGNVTNTQTYISTYLSDKLIQSKGNGTIETPDGQNITWISSNIGRTVDGRWVFYGIILFNNTQSESLSLLNNSIGLVKDIVQRARLHLAFEIRKIQSDYERNRFDRISYTYM